MIGRIAALGALLALTVGLAACDFFALQELKPGVSTAAEVRHKLGQTSMEWQNLDGTETWEFTRQPEGVQNYMVVIGPDRIMREIRQVLDERNFARVEKGMSKDNLRRLLGKPAHTTRFELKQEEVWDWQYEATPEARSWFNVHFDMAGKVLRTSRSREHLGR